MNDDGHDAISEVDKYDEDYPDNIVDVMNEDETTRTILVTNCTDDPQIDRNADKKQGFKLRFTRKQGVNKKSLKICGNWVNTHLSI